MKSIVTKAELDQISALIAKIEQDTASELVTVVYSKSSSYAAYRIAWAAAGALALVGLGHLLWPNVPVLELLGAQTLLGAIGYWLLGMPATLRLIVPRWARERAARDKSRLMFLELGITETRDRSGVLIYLSELERRVEVLGDRGIYQELGQDAWQQLVGELTQSIRGGHAAIGLTRLIERLGAELVAKFPIRPGDTNELSNTVVTDRS